MSFWGVNCLIKKQDIFQAVGVHLFLTKLLDIIQTSILTVWFKIIFLIKKNLGRGLYFYYMDIVHNNWKINNISCLFMWANNRLKLEGVGEAPRASALVKQSVF